MMATLLSGWHDFHFLSPLWLLGIPVACLLTALLLRLQQQRGNWQQLIAPQLLPYLLEGKLPPRQKLPLYGLLGGWIIACLALAGPTWNKIPVPVHKSTAALVVLLDLSPSMFAEDIKPSRLIRARLKLTDLLKQRQEGLTALIAFAGEAHVVTPLTDDTETLINLLPALSPDVMPLQGSNPEMAVELALQLLRDGGHIEGEILLLTDGVADAAIATINQTLSAGYSLSVLGVGTDAGAPIPLAQGGFAKDNSATDGAGIVVAKLNSANLIELANGNGGRFHRLTNSDQDINTLLKPVSANDESTQATERDFDLWYERGSALALLLLPLAALAFRRGWLLSLVPLLLTAVTLAPQPAYAEINNSIPPAATHPDTVNYVATDGISWSALTEQLKQKINWQDLWLRKDQQAQQLLQQQQFGAAADTFENSEWRGAAHYKNGDFDQAARDFAQHNSASAHYNRGNALAQAKQLEQAIAAYDQALALDPELADAKANKAVVEQLLQQQQQQQQQQQKNQNGEQQQEQQNGDSNGGSQGEQQPNSAATNSESTPEEPATNEEQEPSAGKKPSANKEQESSAAKEPSANNTTTNSEDPSTDKNAAENTAPLTPQAEQEQSQPTPDAKQQATNAKLDRAANEAEQALEQWLRQIPDDPSGLMKRKLYYEHELRRKQYRAGTWVPPENGANKRW